MTTVEAVILVTLGILTLIGVIAFFRRGDSNSAVDLAGGFFSSVLSIWSDD